MTNLEAKVVEAWKQAEADLGIRFSSPHLIATGDGRAHEHLGLVHLFGRRIGTLISVMEHPSAAIPRPVGKDYFWSGLSPVYAEYQRHLFIETLNDWQFFGSERERPSWYFGVSLL